jgi:hypothetical protein
MVLGFARSGTSVITRGLKALGVDLGNNIIKHSKKNRWNPTGFFEDEEVIYHINAKIYEKLGYPIRGIPIIPKNEFNHDGLSNIKKYAIKILHDRFSNTHHWGFKTPSSAKIIPFWSALFESEKLKDHYIIALRNPLSSANSLAKLTNIDLETVLLLWLTHIIPIIDETLEKRSIIVSYELIMQNPQKELLRIKSKLAIETLNEDTKSFTEQFLNHDLHHHQFNDSELENHPSIKVAPLCATIYNLLIKVATDELQMNDSEFLFAWKQIKNEFEKSYPLYCYIDKILKSNKASKLKVRQVQKSILWKLLYPARVIDNFFRKLRFKRRAKKRLITAYE